MTNLFRQIELVFFLLTCDRDSVLYYCRRNLCFQKTCKNTVLNNVFVIPKEDTMLISREHGWIALPHWGRVTHICVVNLTIIGLDNGLSPGRHQAIIWTNDGILLIGPLGTNFSEILSKIHILIQENAFENIVCEMAVILSRPQCVNHVYLFYCMSLRNQQRLF